VSGLKRRWPGFSLEVHQEESSFAATKNASNADFDPIPPSKRTWNWGAYVAYWMADAWAVSNWEVGQSPSTCFVREAKERCGAETLVAQLLPSSPSASAGKWQSAPVSLATLSWVSSSPSMAEWVLLWVVSLKRLSGAYLEQLHTPFPVLTRMPFGYYFSYFVVVSRCVLAIVWLGLVCPTNHFVAS
jgi:NCS1 family nucleobase:cation symporter-1